MNDVPTPRWGVEGRDRKAAALLHVLRAHAGAGVVDGHWVDFGCGSGGIAAALAPSVRRIEGLDPDPWPEWADMAARHHNLAFRATPCDGAAPPLPAASADVVICNQVYEHVQDPRRLIANLAAVLRPGGFAYFAGPNLLWPIEPHVFWPFVHWLPRAGAQRAMRALGSRRAQDLDAFSTTAWRLREWFTAAGLQATDALRERVAAEFALRDMNGVSAAAARAPRWPFRLLEPLSPGFVFVLRKPA